MTLYDPALPTPAMIAPAMLARAAMPPPAVAGSPERSAGARPRTPDRMHCRWLSRCRWTDYAALLRRLPADDRAARFHGSLTDAAVDAHVAGLRWPASRVLGAFEESWLVGAVEIALFHRDGDMAAELSVTVDPARQGRRIGTRLMDRALGWARNRWIGHAYMATRLRNRRLCAIGRRFGADLEIDGGHVDLVFRLGPPDFATLATEAAQRWHEAAARWTPPDWQAATLPFSVAEDGCPADR